GELFQTYTLLDIQGNQRAVIDALGNQILQHTHDMLRRPMYANSSDAGEHWTLVDITGAEVRSWDGRGTAKRKRYDALRRLTLADITDPAQAAKAAQPLLAAEPMATHTGYDALNRVTMQITQDGSQAKPGYNEANLLATLDVCIHGAAAWTLFVTGTHYNARG